MMKAVVLHEADDMRVEQRPVPDPGSGEVLLKVNVTSICGTDVKVLHRKLLGQPPKSHIALDFLAAQGDEGGTGDSGQEAQEVVTLVRTVLLQIACRRDHIGKRQLNFHQGCRLTLRHKPFSPGISLQKLRRRRAGG